MDESVRNFLYDHPEYYELAYPEPEDQTPEMCRRMFGRFLAASPRSILDVGCGTARDLASLARDCDDCWGVDPLEKMVDYARRRRPHLRLDVGDMRTVRYDRTFDVILCMGSCLLYALTNADLEATVSTFAAHAHEGTLLILDVHNCAAYLGTDSSLPSTMFEVNADGLRATATADYSFDGRRQLLIRRRTWQVENRGQHTDYCEYRLLFPMEIEGLLSRAGFKVVGMFDNMDLEASDLSGARIYIAAIRADQLPRQA